MDSLYKEVRTIKKLNILISLLTIFAFFGAFAFNPTAAFAQTATQNAGPVGQFGFSVTPGNTAGTVKLNWTDTGKVAKYHVVYGLELGKYQWGSLNMPFTPNSSNSFTVGSLNSGTRYFFAIVAEMNDGTSVTSDPVSLTAS